MSNWIVCQCFRFRSGNYTKQPLRNRIEKPSGCRTRKGGQIERHLVISAKERERLKIFARVKRDTAKEATALCQLEHRYLRRLYKRYCKCRSRFGPDAGGEEAGARGLTVNTADIVSSFCTEIHFVHAVLDNSHKLETPVSELR